MEKRIPKLKTKLNYDNYVLQRSTVGAYTQAAHKRTDSRAGTQCTEQITTLLSGGFHLPSINFIPERDLLVQYYVFGSIPL